ncbi:MAG: YfcE family phosphodiesterase [Treponema sp.]|nr:YfcE family phosphodiesterase [Treponema sp.]
MNVATSHASCFFGDAVAYEALAHAERARLLVISDSHGQTPLVHLLMQQAPVACDALCFCGDGVQDVLPVVAGAASDKTLSQAIPPVVVCVAGNNDAERCSVSGGRTVSIPQHVVMTVAGKTIAVVHGHRQGVYYGLTALSRTARTLGVSCVLYGHTHSARESWEDGIYLMNPGSCAFPRGGLPASCAVLEVGSDFFATVFYRISVRDGIVSYEPFAP